MESIPAQPGSYCLHLVLSKPTHLVVGRLGAFDFPAGDYLYSGSAHGPGGLRGRLKHHLAVAARPHWHIDWLRAVAVLTGGWYSVTPGNLECVWSQALLRLSGAELPAIGFGSADCRSGCPTHLAAFPGGLDILAIEARLAFAGNCHIILQTLRLKEITGQ